MTRLFWWRGKPNFGDALAPLLLAKFAGVTAEWAPADQADVVVIGSIATMLPPGFRGDVLGIGIARPGAGVDLSQSRVHALRGPLTARETNVTGDVALGDPGLLAPQLLDEWPVVRYELGVVPHWQDRSLAARWPGGRVIDVTRPPLDVVRAVGSCRRIVSSSLHGIIVADAFGIPRRWETFARVQGGGFKFTDYAASLGMTINPGEWWAPDPNRVNNLQIGLWEAFTAYEQALAA